MILEKVLMGLALSIRYAYERLNPFEGRGEVPNWMLQIIAFESKLQKGEKVVVFNTSNNIEYMFYTDVTAYPYVPSMPVLDSLIENGFQLFFIDENEVPIPFTPW